MSANELLFLPNLGNWIPLLFTSLSFNIVEISDVKFSKRWYSSQKIISFYMYCTHVFVVFLIHCTCSLPAFYCNRATACIDVNIWRVREGRKFQWRKWRSKMAADRRDIKDLLQKKTFHTAFAHVTTDEGKMKKYPCKFLKASVCCAKLPDNGPEGTNHFVPLENYLLYHHLKPVQFLRHKCLENCQTSEICTKHE